MIGDSALVIIPARLQSKRIPGKNRMPFCGKPLVEWTLESALKLSFPNETVVTTDDPEILKLASKYPSFKFIQRDAALATDEATTVDVVLDVLNKTVSTKKNSPKNIVLLQPTSPLRQLSQIEKAYNLFGESNKKQLVSCKVINESANHLFFKTNTGAIQLLNKQLNDSTLAKEKLFILNGAIYITDINWFIERKNFLTDSIELFNMDELTSVDIDTPADWDRAVSYFQIISKNGDLQ